MLSAKTAIYIKQMHPMKDWYKPQTCSYPYGPLEWVKLQFLSTMVHKKEIHVEENQTTLAPLFERLNFLGKSLSLKLRNSSGQAVKYSNSLLSVKTHSKHLS